MVMKSQVNTNHESSRPDLLQQFIHLNPQLSETKRQRFCSNFYHLLTPQHRRHDCCIAQSKRALKNESCFIDHKEYWQDNTTNLPLIIGHTYCPDHQHQPGKEPSCPTVSTAHNVLSERGLGYLANDSSWYHPNATLIIIARADVLSRINLPKAVNPDNISKDMRNQLSNINWEQIAKTKIKQEARKREFLAQLAPDTEASGDYQNALRFYCDTAYIDREAGFHALANEQLQHAHRLITRQPWLNVDHLYFATDADQVYICGEPNLILHKNELTKQLRELSTQTPESWGEFDACEDGSAIADIFADDVTWGAAIIEQGGNRNLWAAKIRKDADDSGIYSVSGQQPSNLIGDENYMYHTIAEAVAAAIDIWTRYDELQATTAS